MLAGGYTKFSEIFVTVCVAIFLVIAFLPSNVASHVELLLGFVPSKDVILVRPWTLITNSLVHYSVLHLFLNSIVILSIGSALESILSREDMIKLWLLSTIFSNIMFYFFVQAVAPSDAKNIVGIGSSAFAFALIGAASVLMPQAVVMVGIFPFFIPMKMSLAANVLASMELFYVLIELFTKSLSGVAHIAHVAGFAVGYIYSRIIREKRLREYEELLFF